MSLLQLKRPKMALVPLTISAMVILAIVVLFTISAAKSMEDTRPEFIMLQFKDQVCETKADLYEGDGFSIYVPDTWSVYDEYLTAPVKFTVQVAYECSVWIEQYEDAKLSDIEAHFVAEGYSYDANNEKLQKADGTLITQVRLEAKQNDVWAVFRMYNEAYEDSSRVDVVADTCVITGITRKRPEEPESGTVYISDAYYYPPAQYLKEMNWDDIGKKLTEEEYQTLQVYLPILNGDEFTWIYRSDESEEPDTYIHEKKQITIREMLADQLGVHGIEEAEPLVDSFCFVDIFQSGNECMVLLFRNSAWDWLILYEENGVIYGIDMPVRRFQGVQKNGLYLGSGGAYTAYYQRMQFVDGDYIEEDVGTVIRDELFIDGVKKSAAEYEAWKKENLTEGADFYTPLENSVVTIPLSS